MKERIAKLGNKTKIIAGALVLAALMAVNVQVGMNDGSTDVSLNGLETSIFTPAAIATGGGECAINGYKNNDVWYSGRSGKSCWCDNWDKVARNCSY